MTETLDVLKRTTEPVTSSSALVFNDDDLTLVEVPVKIRNEDYILKEADGNVACQYRNASTRCARMNDGKVTGVDGVADVEPFLVSLCLFKVLSTGARVPVDVKVVRSWPSRIIKPLFDRAKEISKLDEDDSEVSLTEQIKKLNERLTKLRESKNPTNTTTTGSV
jgi:hypothetical protein